MKKTITLLLLTILIGCAAPPTKEFDKVEIREYKITAIDPPKHCYFDLKDVATGKEYTHVHVGKHCNNYSQWKIGDVVKLKRVHWTDAGREVSEFEGLYQSLCE